MSMIIPIHCASSYVALHHLDSLAEERLSYRLVGFHTIIFVTIEQFTLRKSVACSDNGSLLLKRVKE